MGVVKQINNLLFLQRYDQYQKLWSNLVKNWQKNIGIYNTGYIIIKNIDDYKNIYSVNPLYLLVNHANGYIEEKVGINK